MSLFYFLQTYAIDHKLLRLSTLNIYVFVLVEEIFVKTL